MSVLVGCDPEVFVKQDGLFKSAWNLIKGTKAAPFKVDRGAVQVDGMALEFNIDPAANEDDFLININTVFHTLRSMVPEYEVSVVPVAHFEKDYFAAQPEEALELGCDPDYNGWTRTINEKPSTNKPMRTASGHVHIGWGENLEGDNHYQMCCDIAKQLDFYLGLPSLVYDNNTERRELYGAPGAFRFKPYGMEYRTLSNAWLNDEKLIKWVFRASNKAWEDWLAGKRPYEDMDIQKVILTSDVQSAREICKSYGIEIPE